MTEPVYLIFLCLFIFALGFALAYFLKGTKSKEVLKNADYQIDQLKLQIDSDKKFYTSQLEDYKNVISSVHNLPTFIPKVTRY